MKRLLVVLAVIAGCAVAQSDYWSLLSAQKRLQAMFDPPATMHIPQYRLCGDTLRGIPSMMAECLVFAVGGKGVAFDSNNGGTMVIWFHKETGKWPSFDQRVSWLLNAVVNSMTEGDSLCVSFGNRTIVWAK